MLTANSRKHLRPADIGPRMHFLKEGCLWHNGRPSIRY